MEINVNYLKTTFDTTKESISKNLKSLKSALESLPEMPNPAYPQSIAVSGIVSASVPGCGYAISLIKSLISGLTDKTLPNITENINDMVNGYEWAESYAMNASVFLNDGTLYTENSMGGGNSNTIRDDNIYADPDDEFTVKYIAIYANGSYKYNMVLNESNKNKSVDEQIKELIDKGVINEGDEIKLSQGITKKQADGSLGDIGWLPQVTYNQKKNKYGNSKDVQKVKKIEDVPEVKTPSSDSTSNAKYDSKYASLDRVVYDANGNEINLAEYLSELENSSELSGVKVDSYAGGVYQNAQDTDYYGVMQLSTIESIKKNLDTTLIRDGYVPHIVVTTRKSGDKSYDSDSKTVLFLNKEDITLPQDRIDLMTSNKGGEITSQFVNRQDLPKGELSFSGKDIDEMLDDTDKVYVKAGSNTISFDSDASNSKEKIDEYIRAYHLAHPDEEVKIIGIDEGKGLFNLEDTYTSTVTVNEDKYLKRIRELEKEYGPLQEIEELKESYVFNDGWEKQQKDYIDKYGGTDLEKSGYDSTVKHLDEVKSKIMNYEPSEEAIKQAKKGDYNGDGENNIADVMLEQKSKVNDSYEYTINDQ